jgi:histidinol dehydrogenase
MQEFNYPLPDTWDMIIQRPEINHDAVRRRVKKILLDVKKDGDKAVKKYMKKFQGTAPKNIRVSAEEINAAESLLSEELKNAIRIARKNISTFHEAQGQKEDRLVIMPGIECWRRSVGIERIGIYIPGGTAPLFSSVLMLGVPAKLGGCKEIVLCSPASENGNIHPAILFSAKLCGISEIYQVGGAQAIAAMAYGTASIKKVFKIFGPGNSYVTVAKQLVQLDGIAIDIPAGPSEVLVIADESASAVFVAADLLSQAEHGPDSQVILITTNAGLVKQVKSELKLQLKSLPRKSIAKDSLKHTRFVLLKTMYEALDLSNRYAPEHLILAVKEPEQYIDRIISAGSVFLGHYSPESAGDYATGTNHTLPTNGYAAMYSGVSLDNFVKKITFQHLTREGLGLISGTVTTMAEAEGLVAHKNAVTLRLKNI